MDQQGSSKWKLKDPHVCRVFFSSPFNGMEKEREALTSFYWPQLQSKCNAQGVQFVPVDMRWGITTDHAVAAQTISICLREIDRSDIFVGFFGARYGWYGRENETLQQNFDKAKETHPWVDEYRDRSVTEIEFLRGHLNNPGELPAFICFRNLEYDARQREDAVQKGNKKDITKYSVEDETAAEKLEDLKRRVKETESKCIGVNLCYTDPAEGAKLMFEAVDKVLTEYFLVQQETPVSNRIKDINMQNVYIDSKSTAFVGFDKEKNDLKSFVKNEDANQLLIIGEAGSGKSVLMSHWVKENRDSEKVVYHYVGANAKNRDIHNTLCSIVRNLHSLYLETAKDQEPFSDIEAENKFDLGLKKKSKDELKNQWTDLMDKIAKLDIKVTIAIDGLNWIILPSKIIRPLYWIPKSVPKNIKLVTSTQSTDVVTIKELIDERKASSLCLTILELENRINLCQKCLELHGKALTEDQLNIIVSQDQAGNPLFLKIVIEELFQFGKFRELDKKIDDLISSKSPQDLFTKYLDRLEKDFNSTEYSGNLVEMVMTTIALSRDGIPETKLREITNVPYHIWSPLFYAMESYLMKKGENIDFAFPELRAAVLERYGTDEKRKQVRSTLANVIMKDIMVKVKGLNSKAVNDADVSDLCWYIKQIDSKDMMFEVLSQYVLIESLLVHNKFELLEYIWYLDLPVDELSKLLISGLDMHICRLYCDMYDQFKDMSKLPDKCSTYLSNLHILVDDAGLITIREQFLKRRIRLLENLNSLTPDQEQDLYHTYYTLGCYYCDMFEPNKALPYHEKAKTYFEKLISENEKPSVELKAEMGYIYNGLGLAYQSLDRNEDGAEYFKKSMAAHEEIPDHKDSKENYNKAKNNLGRTYLAMKDYTTAISVLEEVVVAEEEIYLEALTPDASYALTNLGICYRKVKQLDKAEVVYKRALEIKKAALGEYHKDMAIAYVNMSNLALDHKKYDEMEMWLKKCLALYERLDQSDIDSAWKARENLALSLAIQRKFEECEPLLWMTVERYIKRGEMERFALPALHRRVMTWYVQEEKHDQAERLANIYFDTAPKLVKPMAYIALHSAYGNKFPSGGGPGLPEDRTLEAGLKRFPDDRDLVMYYAAGELLPKKELQKMVDFVNKSIKDMSVTRDIYDIMEEDWPEGIIPFCEGVKEKYKDEKEFMEYLALRYALDKDPIKALETCKDIDDNTKASEYEDMLKLLADENTDEVWKILSATTLSDIFKNAMKICLNICDENTKEGEITQE